MCQTFPDFVFIGKTSLHVTMPLNVKYALILNIHKSGIDSELMPLSELVKSFVRKRKSILF